MWPGIIERQQLSCSMRIDLPPDRPSLEMSAKDGGTITLSPLMDSDREFIEAGLEELSIESRYSRFGQGVSSLSDRELDYLSSVDQRSHVAWGAAIEGEIAGVGRYIVLAPGECAEFAITVIDAFQRRGVGEALFRALAAIARHDGVSELCFEAQDDNEVVIHIMHEFDIAAFSADGTIGARLRLSDFPADPAAGEIVEVMERMRNL
jgi:GNAT superfamily N-acetyltransferase